MLLQGLEILPRARLAYQAARCWRSSTSTRRSRDGPRLSSSTSSRTPTSQGSRHPKRWQDIDELLAAGIDVFTTLNVQHIESLNDVVGGITGITVRETVPDFFFDRADEVVMVDVSADDLLARLGAGKVYLPSRSSAPPATSSARAT